MMAAGEHFSRGTGISIALGSFAWVQNLWQGMQEGRAEFAALFEPAPWRKDGTVWPVVRPGDWVYLVFEGVTLARAPLLRFELPDPERWERRGTLRLDLTGLEAVGCVFAFQRFSRGWRYWKTEPESMRPIHPAALASPDAWFEYAEDLAGLSPGDRRLAWKRDQRPKPVRADPEERWA